MHSFNFWYIIFLLLQFHDIRMNWMPPPFRMFQAAGKRIPDAWRDARNFFPFISIFFRKYTIFALALGRVQSFIVSSGNRGDGIAFLKDEPGLNSDDGISEDQKGPGGFI
jgi:hypothetical protein